MKKAIISGTGLHESRFDYISVETDHPTIIGSQADQGIKDDLQAIRMMKPVTEKANKQTTAVKEGIDTAETVKTVMLPIRPKREVKKGNDSDGQDFDPSVYDCLIEKPDQVFTPIFTFPIAEHRPESLRNLVNTIYSRGQFISKATGGYFYASEEMVENLQSGYHIHMHQVVETIEKAGPGALCGMVIEQDMIVFNGFPTTSDEELMGAWYNLFDAINTTAIKQRHVHPKRVNVLNEKYAFRNWLTSLGMNGPELKKTRWYLYRNLTGNTAFRIPNNKKVVNRV